MAYSIRPNNDFVLFNATQNDNPNQLDVQFFTDYTQHATMASAGIPGDGGVFNLSSLFVTATRSTADQTEYGITNGHGVIQMNHTNPASFHRFYNDFILNGVPDPAAGEVTKYEMEIGLELTTTQWASGDIYGLHRFGFWGTSPSNPTDGIFLEYWVNGTYSSLLDAYLDGTPLDGTWHVTLLKDGTVTGRTDTGMAFSLNEVYQLYLSVERNASGGENNIFIKYNIKNKTRDESVSGTINPTLSNLPSASADYMYMQWTGYGIGAGQEWTGLSPKYLIDYMGARIRRPIRREILL